MLRRSLTLLSLTSAWLAQGKKCSGIHRLSKDHHLVADGDGNQHEVWDSSDPQTLPSSIFSEAGDSVSETSSAATPVTTDSEDEGDTSNDDQGSNNEGSSGGNSTGDPYTSGSLDMFTKRLLLDFSDVKEGDDATEKLAEGGFYMTTYTVGDSSDGNIPREHMEENVKLGDGALLMTTQAYSGSGNVKASEITTNEAYLYASARVVLKSTPVKGVCIGHFFYGGQ